MNASPDSDDARSDVTRITEAVALAESWRNEIGSLPTSEQLGERTRFAAKYSGWLLNQGKPAKAKAVTDECYDQAMQGDWVYERRDNGKVVERMDLHLDGETSTTQFTGPDGVTSETRSGTVRLWRSGGVKVFTSHLGDAPGSQVSFVYRLDGDNLITVSGLLSNETSLPETRL